MKWVKMVEVERYHDFLNFISFPSSLAIKTIRKFDSYYREGIDVRLPLPRAIVTVKTYMATKNAVSPPPDGSATEITVIDPTGKTAFYPVSRLTGTTPWTPIEKTIDFSGAPENMTLNVFSRIGASDGINPSITWFDDLKIYQDDTLIYSDDFSKWDPVIGAGIGAPIGGAAGYLLREPLGPMVSEAVGAVLGGALGGGVGLLTGMGIIPVPQIPIPALEAPPEGPEAPARLGKYQITG